MREHQPQESCLGRGLSWQKWLIIGLIVAALHFLPWTFPPQYVHIMIMIFLFTIMGQGWNILGGYAGQFSFGHSLFFGLGAYTSTLMFVHWGLSPWIGMVFSCFIGIMMGLFVGYLSFRFGLSGPFFALIMLAFAEVFHMISISWKAVGAALGLLIPLKGTSIALMQFVDKKPFYFITLWMMIGALYLVWRMEKTRMGLYFLAVREDNDAAEALGVNTLKYKMVAMTLSAGLTSIGGTIYAQYLLYIDPDITFGVMNSIEILIRPIIGGPGTVLGPLLGSLVLTPLAEFTRLAFQSYGGVYLMIYGAILVGVIMFLPDGIMGLAKRVFYKMRKEVG
ncbi:MAG: branched-chain amino acid ABC transporter permease [Deltaproteobacteria bacterium]|nr:branched-chain amino acid ABC transporter permease [Deltaproteobacteria bacterium]MBW2342065.1 branched-chain amino acid ABC transporter permease [Deltaproteobacteria bacterium]